MTPEEQTESAAAALYERDLEGTGVNGRPWAQLPQSVKDIWLRAVSA